MFDLVFESEYSDYDHTNEYLHLIRNAPSDFVPDIGSIVNFEDDSFYRDKVHSSNCGYKFIVISKEFIYSRGKDFEDFLTVKIWLKPFQ
jgi:hypothetical protein